MPADATADAEAVELPDEAWLVALAMLPKMGPSRLLAITLLYPAREAWRLACSGRAAYEPGLAQRMGAKPADLAREWRRAAAVIDPAAAWAAHGGCTVAGRGSADYPEPLAHDLDPPAVVFLRGDRAALDGPRVAVVGTRRCTRYGFEVAHELGHDLARAGVRVVSGLALGIDGAAHRGVLDAGPDAAPPIAVVASGLDVVYPKAHRSLWTEVPAVGGLLLSECPLGTQPESWRFPSRNRIIAALADAVVVVESPGQGGSMYTVEQAMKRDRPVMAVPGSVRAAASAGTNELIFSGGFMARDAADVLGLLGIDAPTAEKPDHRPPPDADGRRVLRAIGWEPATLDTLVTRTGLELGPLSVAIATLESSGWLRRQGLWFERSGRE